VNDGTPSALFRLALAAALLVGARYAGAAVSADPPPLPLASPEAAGFSASGLDAVDRVVENAVADHAFPGAVLAIGRHGSLVRWRGFGHLTYDAHARAVSTGTMYDLASVTKVVATTTVVMTLVEQGRLDLDRPVRAYVPAFTGGAKDEVRVRQLLTHSGGLQWWAPLYKELRGHRAYLERIVTMPLAYPPGTKSVYSDLGLILLGEVIERAAGQKLEDLARTRVFEPLAMKDARFCPPPALRDRIAPTERDPWRGRVLVGEVHDENAFALGGVAPHAGLFDTAGDLARFAQMMLNGGTLEGHRIVSRATIETFTTRAGVPHSSRALGWDTPTDEAGRRSSVPGEPGYSSAGSLLSPRSFGHTGFTGTSIWMDPDRDLFVILLTNRVYPTRENHKILGVRSRLADAVARALVAP
jgi:CubicO group peptidase (beta-lactamase class C family)